MVTFPKTAAKEQDSEDELEDVRRDSVALDFMDLFDGVGLMKDHPYKIVLRGAKPPFALATARRVPYHLYEKVQGELQRMVELGMITEINLWSVSITSLREVSLLFIW